MTDRQKLKLAPPLARMTMHAVPEEPLLAPDADLGGIGIDWNDVPPLHGEGLLLWEYLAETFRDHPTRFREADRPALIAFCEVAEMRALAADQLREEGVTVTGRSASDRSRIVKNPAWSMWRDADTSFRAWSNALALNPTARRRAGIADTAPNTGDNPFQPKGF